ncbi:uncharacterized protein BDZ99DRAFT_465150 [Mytilinidion resinicola]|uniref:Uncharacterized protein n=1 Tax=Mytilinidion resinicola TaxID=574789 RepID=A0A6A6YEI2_9PEZI|nr:uncharacterized protein BDZ99DRAFT_465150 [Mytilinidion resinicola]KAF2807231.1 hypothetical protein BDZ99DRAFT_465150 [Mytilinidion resinicola]
MRGPSTYYYCCQCGDGPQNITIQPSCINCGHKGCDGCSSDSKECVDFDDDPRLPGSTPVMSFVGKVLVSASDSYGHNLAPMPSPRPTIPTIDTVSNEIRAHHHNLFDHQSFSTAHLPVHHTHGNDSIPCGDPTDGGKGWVWYCCKCGDGGLGPMTVGCPMCGEVKCKDCKIEYV